MWLWLLASAVGAGGLAVEIANLGEFPLLQPLASSGETVTVYVAMRNEAARCGAFLDAVLGLDGLAAVVVADDGSTDLTSARVRTASRQDARVRYVACSGGKSAALARAVEAHPPATPWLLFLDADVRVDAGAAAALVGFARARRVAAASAWPRVDSPTIWSELLAPSITLFLLQALPMWMARGSDPRFAAGNGQCFLVRADAYSASGGHAALRDVVEDVALARALKRAGFPVALASAAEIARVEGYRSLAENMRGLGRSLYFGAGPLGCAFVALWQCALVVAWPLLYAARIVTALRMRESVRSVALAPVGAALTVATAVLALVEGLRGRIAWRGRRLGEGASVQVGEKAARP